MKRHKLPKGKRYGRKKTQNKKNEVRLTYPRGPYMFPRSPKDRAKGASVDGGRRYGSSAAITRKRNPKSKYKP